MSMPLVPSELDLRDFMFMPLDVMRLRDSDAAALSSGDGFRAAVLLWCASWHQVPAATLPNDDRALARFAGLGRDMKGWEAVREDALRGFVECEDGRLYHPVVAEKALEGWLEKLNQRKTSAAGNAAKHQTTFDPKPFDDQIADARRMLHALNPNSKSLSKRVPRGAPTPSRRPPNGRPTGDEREVDGAPVVLPSTSQVKGRDTEGTPRDLDQKQKTEPVPGERMSEDWKMPSVYGEDAIAQGVEPSAISGRWDAFRDAWLQRKTWPEDWRAAWRGWLRNSPSKPKVSRTATARASPPNSSAASNQVFIARDTPEWKAWDRWGRANGKPTGYPSDAQLDSKRGWQFPSRWPPGHSDTVVTLDQFREERVA